MIKTYAQIWPDPIEYVGYWKIVSVSNIFEKDNCFKLYNFDILTDKNLLINSSAISVKNKECSDNYILSNYFTNTPNIITENNYSINDYKLWQSYYFKFSLLPPDTNVKLYISPLILNISESIPKDYFNYPEYNYWYKIYNTSSNLNSNYFIIWTWIISLIILGLVIYKKFKK